MQTLNISIDIPQNKAIDVAVIKQKVMNFAMGLIRNESKIIAEEKDEDMERAMKFIDSLVVPGGKNIPVVDDSIEALVGQKY